MRFSPILHPEVVLGRRGLKEEVKLYEVWHSLLTLDPTVNYAIDAWKLSPDHAKFRYLMERDDVFTQHVALTKKFKEEKGGVYHFSKPLLEDLARMDKEFPVDILPERFLGYISFPPETIFDEQGFIHGGYIYIGPKREAPKMIEQPGDDKTDKCIWISYIVNPQLNERIHVGPIGSMLMPFLTTKTANLDGAHFDFAMDGISGSKKVTDLADRKKREVVFQTLLNTLIFIHSKEPILESYKPFPQTGLSKKEILRRGGVINECSIPVTFVNRNYHGVTYVKDKTSVRGHPRWQRCGKGFAEVKLIWIDPHEREYKKAING